jgi:hypothetical protein
MPMAFSIMAILGDYYDIAVKKHKHFYRSFHLNVGVGRVGIGIFYPSGEPTQPTPISL